MYVQRILMKFASKYTWCLRACIIEISPDSHLLRMTGTILVPELKNTNVCEKQKHR